MSDTLHDVVRWDPDLVQQLAEDYGLRAAVFYYDSKHVKRTYVFNNPDTGGQWVCRGIEQAVCFIKGVEMGRQK